MTRVVTFSSPNRTPNRPHDPWRHGEPSLAEVMADPLVALVMRRDKLDPDQVWPILAQARARLSAAQGAAA